MAARKILITGATGKQGGALIESLLSSSKDIFSLYGLTRKATSPSATKLESRGVHIVEGNTLQPAPIFSKIGSIWGVFSVTVPGKTEEEQAKPLIDAAIKAGCQHFVFTSVYRGANQETDPTPVPHFITKFNIEKYLIEKAAASPQGMTWTILRPAAFYDNLTPDFAGSMFGPWVRGSGDTKAAMIGCKDIGRVAAIAFEQPEKYAGRSLTLVAEQYNFKELATKFKEVVGTDLPMAPAFLANFIKWMVGDLSKMFKWFGEGGYAGPVAGDRDFPVVLEDFETWLKNSSKFQVK